MQRYYDVVVIGSGFGGAISAHRLAQAQKAAGLPVSVCVLERGKRYQRGEFPRDVARAKEWWWRDGGRRGWKGLLEWRSFNNASILCASGVGGTSLVYLDVQIDAFESTFEITDPVTGARRWPELGHGRSWFSELRPYYDSVARMLHPTPIPDPTVKTRALRAAAEAIGEGHRFRLLDLAVYWGDRGVLVNDPYNQGGPPQAGCRHCGECYIGCNTHSKNTLDLTYIWQAERIGAEVYSQHHVTRIEPNSPNHAVHPNGYTVHYEDLRWGFSGKVSAQTLIVAAGTMGSTELMLRAQRGYKQAGKRVDPTLPNLSPMLGQYFSGNGDFGAAAFETNRQVNPMVGPTITAVLDYHDKLNQHGFLIEDGGFPDILRAYLRRFPGGFAFGRRILGALKDLVGRDRNRKLVEGIFEQLDFQTVRDCLPFLVMGQDAADGEMGLDDEGNLSIDWSHSQTMPFLREVESVLRQVSEAPAPGLDGNVVFAPTWSIGKNLVTVHPLGGCPIGADATCGVVDTYGKVFNYENLYILDGSIVPSAIGPNPSKTIGALTERAATRIAQERYGLAAVPAGHSR
jgi:cholesterol oxidase